MKMNWLLTAFCFTASSTFLPASQLEQLRAQRAALDEKIKSLETVSQPNKLSNDSSKSPVQASDSNKSDKPAYYTIRKGDNMVKIAKRLSCSPKTLASINGLKQSSVIFPGQKLRIPRSAARSSESRKSMSKEIAAKAATHVIREGETYTSIAKIYDTTPARLIAANPKAKATALREGMKISVPGGSGAMAKSTRATKPAEAKSEPPAQKKPIAAPTAAVAKSSAPAPAISQESPKPSVSEKMVAAEVTAAPAPEKSPVAESTPVSTASTEEKIRPVTIEGEVSFKDFASQHGTDVARLNSLNGLDLSGATVLAKGSELYVPTQF